MANSYIYPLDQGGTAQIAVSPPSGPPALFDPVGWTELVEADCTALVDPNSRSTAFSHDASGWTISWTSGGSAIHDRTGEMPRRAAVISTLTGGSSFDWDTHMVEVLLFVDAVADLTHTSPFRTGIGVAIGLNDWTLGTGVAIQTWDIDPDQAVTRISGNANAANISTNNGFEAIHMAYRKAADGGITGRTYRYLTAGTTFLTDDPALNGDTTIAATAASGVSLGVFGIVATASAIAEHDQTVQVYYRITPIPAIETEAQIEAL